jgi:hypothetical protein
MLDQIIQRLTRMIKFDNTVYREIADDEAATMEAVAIVAVSSLLSAVGMAVRLRRVDTFFIQFIVGIAIGWFLWSYLAMFIGTRLFGGKADFWQMARTIGYAYAPTAVGILGLFSWLGSLVTFVASLLALALGFFAVRETLGLSTEKAVITVIIGWLVMAVVSSVLL